MSVYFSKHSLNGYRDHTGSVDPAIRDRLLSAINELTLLGPGNRHKDQSTRMQPLTSRSRSTRAASGPRNEKTQSGDQVKDFKESASGTVSTHGVLKEKVKHKTTTVSSNAEKAGKVKVFAKVLHQETDHKTIKVTSLTTSEELVNTVLKEYDAHTKDPNLFYLAMETGMKSEDSGLPISKMIVLENAARPLELQACQPQGQTKFHLKMKSGGLVRVRTNILNTGSTFKTVFISRCTTAQELIKLVINGCKSDEAPENFVLREGSADFQVDRIIAHHEYPLEVQSNWKPEQEHSFFLTRINKTCDTSPEQTTEIITSDELKNEISKQNQTINTLNETIKILQMEQCIEIEEQSVLRSSRNNFSRRTTSSVDSGVVKDDYDQIDDINIKPFEDCQDKGLDIDKDEGQAAGDKIRQRKTSINALDLNHVPRKERISTDVRSKSSRSQIDKLRHSFFQFQKQSIEVDALDLCDNKKVEEIKIDSRNSQIEKFRLKFLEYYNVKIDSPTRRISSVLTPPRQRPANLDRKKYLERTHSASDVEYTKIDPKFQSELQTVHSRRSSLNSSCNKETDIFESSPSTDPTFLSIYDILDGMKMVNVTLNKDPDKEFGLEIVQVTQTGSPVNTEYDADDVVYVFHKGDGQTAVVDGPVESSMRGFTAIAEEESSSKYSDFKEERDDVFLKNNSESHLNNHTCSSHRTETNAMKLNNVKAQDKKINDGSTNESASVNLRSRCALSHWREGLGSKPRHGVRIVGIAKGSIAEDTGKLERDDVIVEVNGKNVLNSSLDVVIATLKERDTVHLVVAREQEPSDSKETTVEPSPVPSPVQSYHDQEDVKALTDQVQQLVTKVTQLEESLTKKDKTIASLKKSLIKKKLRISSKEKITEGVQVIV